MWLNCCCAAYFDLTYSRLGLRELFVSPAIEKLVRFRLLRQIFASLVGQYSLVLPKSRQGRPGQLHVSSFVSDGGSIQPQVGMCLFFHWSSSFVVLRDALSVIHQQRAIFSRFWTKHNVSRVSRLILSCLVGKFYGIFRVGIRLGPRDPSLMLA